MTSVSGNQRITVAVRTRPILREGASMHAQEKFELPALRRVGDTDLLVELTKADEPAKSSTFHFDYIFDQESTQLEVYEDCVVEMVDAALAGVNASILAYGQTGSGKTFTVLGDVKPNPLENDLLTPDSGLFLRVLDDLMEYKLRKNSQGWHVVVGLSCVEIYNDNIRDLFGGDKTGPPPPVKAVMIGDDVFLPNLIVKEMITLQAVFSEIQLAIARRASRATDSNATSSRSHCLFFIEVLQQKNSAPPPSLSLVTNSSGSGEDKGVKRIVPSVAKNSASINSMAKELPEYEMPFQGTVYRLMNQKEPVYASKIILADLAGSERIARSGVSGVGLAEATSINSSLSALGNVVHSLYEGGYVSYRNTNLTRLLKPTFSHPSSRVLLLAQCAPTQLTFEETVSTLHFANKVKAMKVNTVTGSETEKIQFEYIETARTCEAICADLRIFSCTFETKPTTIRRMNPNHKGLFYDPHKGGPKERLAELEAIGVLKGAQQERDQLRKQQQEKEAKLKESLEEDVRMEREKLVKEHQESMKDATAELQKESELQANHKKHQLFQTVWMEKNLLELQAASKRSSALVNFYSLLKQLGTKELSGRAKDLGRITETLLQGHAKSTLSSDSGIVALDERYAVSAWYHCVSKRYFAAVTEQQEMQQSLLNAIIRNNWLVRWKAKHSYLTK